MYERFLKLLQLNNLTASEVSRMTGLRTSLFSDWKSGRATPKIDKLIKIARALGVSLEYLTGEITWEEEVSRQFEEKKTNFVCVEKVDESCLTEDAIDEDGNIDWLGYDNSLDTDEELFNSDEYKTYLELFYNIQFNINHEREAFNEYKSDFEYYKSELYKSHQEELQRALDLEEASLKINELRRAAGLTQARFCELLKIPLRTLQAWEAGDRTPPAYINDLIEYRLKKEGLI